MPLAPVVIISSSPPQTFARALTPAELYSPPRSSGSPIKEGAKRFKASNIARDRFSAGTTSAHALSRKPGAENIPLLSPGSAKFRSQSSSKSKDGAEKSTSNLKFVTKRTASSARKVSNHFPQAQVKPEGTKITVEKDTFDFDSSPKDADTFNVDVEGLCTSPPCSPAMEKAVPRRLDWTPVKSNGIVQETPESGCRDFELSNGLLDSYAFTTTNMPAKATTTARALSNDDLSTRKRIDIVMATEAKSETLTSRVKVAKEAKKVAPKKASKPKVKAVPKKPLTITGLATSAYNNVGQEDVKLQPLVEFLGSTQAATGHDSDDGPDTSLGKPKTTAKKARAKTKAPVKSLLVSPRSAIRTAAEQAVLFGPASQLAREDSPALIRDTLEALKRSEGPFSDPISPQRTQPFSIEATSPQVVFGTAKFVRRRNLWAAADRDENNALLQVENEAETVGLADSPAMRQALAGKDALVQLHAQNRQSLPLGLESTVAAVERTPCTKTVASIIDINDITTPGLPRSTTVLTKPVVRTIHTARQLDVSIPVDGTGDKHIVNKQVETPVVPKKSPPKTKSKTSMPCFEGWSDDKLKKQIKSYGFKAIRKREKMVELLVECWKSKNNVEDVEEEPEAADTRTHGDFISKVHDVSARPEPKAKKPRAKRKSDESGAPKEPKRRKKSVTETVDGETKAKTPRKRTTKKNAVVEDEIVDVDEVVGHNPQEELPKARHQVQPALKAAVSTQRPATPPPTIPQLDFDSSSPAVENSAHLAVKATSTISPDQTQSPDIMSQIHTAINHVPKTASNPRDSRNHQVSPTWREKILMYDPIVLEELTVWLNTEGFRAIGEDREVSPLQVRDWCEQNGVCCLGVGGGWRGNRKRVDGE